MFAPGGAERRCPEGRASALGASALGAARRRSSIDLSEHDVLRANDRDRIGDHVTASHFVERL